MSGRGTNGIFLLSISLLLLNLNIFIFSSWNAGTGNEKAIIIFGIVTEAIIMCFLVICNIYMHINLWNNELLKGSTSGKILKICFICLSVVSVGAIGTVVSIFYKMINYIW